MYSNYLSIVHRITGIPAATGVVFYEKKKNDVRGVMRVINIGLRKDGNRVWEKKIIL